MKRTLSLLLLCLCILTSGLIRPLFIYASVDDFEYDEEAVEDDFEEDSGSGGSDDVEKKYQSEINNLNDKLKQLEEEKKRISAGINNTKSEKERALAEKNALDWQISLTKQEIEAYLERISLLENNIEAKLTGIGAKQRDILAKQGEIDSSYEILRKRLRAKYMQDTTTTLGLIVGADSFSDLLTRVEYIRRIAEHDRELMAGLTEQRKELEVQKSGLESDMAALEEIKANVEEDRLETEAKKAELGVHLQKAQIQVQDLAEMERAYSADLEKNKKLQDEAKAALDRIFREIEWSKNAYEGGVMAWPIPAYTPGNRLNVTCEVGPRFGGSDIHSGIDLSGAGIFGSNVVAAHSGTVVTANTSFVQGYGYGKFIIIDHGVDENGNTIATVYAHLSGLSVNVGQTVKRGQVIGQVGSTGWSTGPHLHFEVRINGKWTNPRPYIFT